MAGTDASLPPARRGAGLAVAIIAAGLAFRLFLAIAWPNDEPDDGRLYARLARNVLEHGVYSEAATSPFPPTYIRMPGYPLVLAAIYRVAGAGADGAVRVVQAFADTLSCALAAALAVAWLPGSATEEERRRAFLLALGLAALCPFTAIYVATILSEPWRFLLVLGCVLAGTLALGDEDDRRRRALWLLAGLAGGGAALVRPDGALPVGALGAVLVLRALQRARPPFADAASGLRRAAADGLVLTAGFALALVPWTVRNASVFGVFEPIAPESATMPGEFVAAGYERWLATWVDDPRYVEPLDWNLDRRRIVIEQIPDSAFDSEAERDRVRQLLDRYDHPAEAAPSSAEPASADPDDEVPSEDDDVAMTPAIDREFAAIAAERIGRHPLRYALALPLERAAAMWLDTHSRYYPFAGELRPLAVLRGHPVKLVALSLFAALTGLYTLAGLAGAWRLARRGGGGTALALLALLVVPRFALLAGRRNPEPRYTTEFFLLLAAAAGGLALDGREEERARHGERQDP